VKYLVTINPLIYNQNMSIAVFSDIHGNLEALEAILKDIHKKRRQIKEIYFLGDAVTFGPDSSACLKLLKKHDVKCVIGNHEQRFIKYCKTIAEMTVGGIKHKEYIYHSLDNEDIEFIKSMPLERTLDFKGYKLYFAHYSYDDKGVLSEDMDVFREDVLDKLFKKSDCDVVFYGHIHARKLYIRSGQKSYFNLGSSGCAKGDITNYTIFDVGRSVEGNFDIYRVQVKFNRAKFEKKMHLANMPEKEFFGTKFFGIDFKKGDV